MQYRVLSWSQAPEQPTKLTITTRGMMPTDEVYGIPKLRNLGTFIAREESTSEDTSSALFAEDRS
jgi:hypothetical protein